MAQDSRNLPRPGRAAVARVLWCCLLLAGAGCRAPAARVASTKPGDHILPCSVVFARQIVEDSVVEMACHPGRACQAAVGRLGAVARAGEWPGPGETWKYYRSHQPP